MGNIIQIMGDQTFFLNLSKYFSSDELRRFFRIVSGGLFVHLDATEKLFVSYRAWLETLKEAQSGKAEEKLKRRLFGTDEPALQYLIEGNTCLVGYFLPATNESLRGAPVKLFQGGLLDARDFLHPKDPVLLATKAFRVRNTPHFLILDLQLGETKITLPLPRLTQLAQSMRQSRYLLKRFPDLSRALRDTLVPLASLLQQTQELRSRERILIREADRGNGLKFRRYGKIAFSFDANNSLCSIVDISRSGTKRIFLDDLASFRRGQINLRGARVGDPKSKFPLSLRMRKVPFKVHIQALDEFLELLGRTPQLKSKLPQFYSAADLVRLFVEMFRNSKPFGSPTLLRIGKFKKLTSAEFRAIGRFRFLIIERNIIRGFSRLPRPKEKKTKKEAPEVKN